MGRHIIVALESVIIIRFALAHEMAIDGLHVVAHIGVGIFVDGKRTTGVFDEKVQQARLGQRVGQVSGYLFGYEMESACAGLQGKFYLAYHEFKKLILN